jgi:hypothetical protein
LHLDYQRIFAMTRHKLLAILFSCWFAFVARDVDAADWRQVVQASAGDAIYYLDVDSPRSSPDGNVIARVLAEFSPVRRTSDGHVYASSMHLIRFDCVGERLADQAIVFYAEPGGRGAAVKRMERTAEQANADLETTDPQSRGKALVFAACEVLTRGKPTAR